MICEWCERTMSQEDPKLLLSVDPTGLVPSLQSLTFCSFVCLAEAVGAVNDKGIDQLLELMEGSMN